MIRIMAGLRCRFRQTQLLTRRDVKIGLPPRGESKRPRYRPALGLDSPFANGSDHPFPTQITMGQQLNKIIKRKRRAAYLKRKKVAAAAAKKK
jgi:hypothetical protein